MVGSAGTHNGFLYLKTTKMYVLLHETVGSTEPTDGFLDPAMQETLALLHETEGSEDPSNGFLCCKTKKMYGAPLGVCSGTEFGHFLSAEQKVTNLGAPAMPGPPLFPLSVSPTPALSLSLCPPSPSFSPSPLLPLPGIAWMLDKYHPITSQRTTRTCLTQTVTSES